MTAFNVWVEVEPCDPPSGGGGGTGMIPFSEPLALTDVNTFGPLTHVPAADPVTITVNGHSFFNIGTPPDFSVSGVAITWLSTTYSVSPSDEVVANYYY